MSENSASEPAAGSPATPTTPAPRAAETVAATPVQLAWLDRELAHWQAEGLVAPEAASAIRGRYVATRRFKLASLVLTLGGAFVGVGLIWLIAANLDVLSPVVRFVGIVAIWLALVTLTEVLARRRTPILAAISGLLAAVAFGGVIFQAAQSLHVPAYTASLVGYWAAGALLYAYATAGFGPLVVGVGTGSVWLIWTVASTAESPVDVAGPLLITAALLSAIAVVHRRWAALPRTFASTWRVAGAALGLLGLFWVAFPATRERVTHPERLAVAIGIVTLVVLAALWLADGFGRWEVVAGVLVAAAGGLLLLWRPEVPDSGSLPGVLVVRSVVAMVIFLGAATWYAVLGVRRDLPGLTWIAAAALVIFTVAQSATVFARILPGSLVFLLVGVLLLVLGFLVERGRRRLVAAVEAAEADQPEGGVA